VGHRPPISSTSIPGADRSTITGAGPGRDGGVSADWSGTSVIVTGRKVVSVFAAGASSCFQRNSCRTAIPCRGATSDTDAPGRSASSTIRLLSASLKRRRLPGGVERADGIWLAGAGTAPLVI
jgi:hypothetical protein